MAQRSKQRDLYVKVKGNVPKIGKGEAELKYTRAPVAKGLRVMTKAPRVNGGKSFVVSHSELLTDINLSSGYSVASFPIQPGLAVSFPWLSNLATNFESYRIRKLRYRYEPQCATTSSGTILMAIDYDALDPAPLDKTELMQKAGAVRCAVWDRVTCVMKNNGSTFKRLFVRSGDPPSGSDIKTYDIGNLFIATEGPSVILVGELYIDYELEFLTPETNKLDEVASGSYTCLFTGTALNAPFTGGAQSPLGALDITFTNTAFRINRVGTYLMILRLTGTTTVANMSLAITALSTNTDSRSNCTNYYPTFINSASTGWLMVLEPQIYAAGDGFTINLNGTAATMSSLIMTVSPYSISTSAPAPILPGMFVQPSKSGPRSGTEVLHEYLASIDLLLEQERYMDPRVEDVAPPLNRPGIFNRGTGNVHHLGRL